MRVLLLSAYAAQSHRQWRDSLLQMFPQWDWEVLELPPRHFSWRVRGNALYWSQSRSELLNQPWDLLVATSMVDMATLRGLTPALFEVPTVVYFHENQFAFPSRARQQGLLEAQVTSLYCALAADRLLFNSQYNCDSFLSGAQHLLQRLPDYVPQGVVATLRARSEVVPVACDVAAFAAATPHWPAPAGNSNRRPLRIIWVGRFEHDKGGDDLLEILRGLDRSGLDYELAVIGQQFRQSPAVFDLIASEQVHRLVQFGYVESRDDFQRILAAGDIVLSTAKHEFQGLAIMEAVAAGCLPVVPDALCYPEIYPPQFCYAPQAGAAVARLLSLASDWRAGTAGLPDVANWSPAVLRDRYAAAFEAAREAANTR